MPRHHDRNREANMIEDACYGLGSVADDYIRRVSGRWLHPCDAGAMPHIDVFRTLAPAEVQDIRRDTAMLLAFFSSQRLMRGLEINLTELEKACRTFLVQNQATFLGMIRGS